MYFFGFWAMFIVFKSSFVFISYDKILSFGRIVLSHVEMLFTV